MRRFELGFAAAKSSSDGRHRERSGSSPFPSPFQPSVGKPTEEQRRPDIDRGIHDIDLARWYGRGVRSRASRRASVYEISVPGDIDNAVISLVFESGHLGVIHYTERHHGTTSTRAIVQKHAANRYIQRRR